MSEPFDTETMAELCTRQGRHTEALDIYRRLLQSAGDDQTRARRVRRIAEIEAARRPPNPPSPRGPLPTPGISVERDGDRALVAWSLPAGTTAPALEVALFVCAAAGVEVRRQILPVAGPRGETAVVCGGAVCILVAAGRIADGRFASLVHDRDS